MSADILGPSVPGLNDALNIGFGQFLLSVMLLIDRFTILSNILTCIVAFLFPSSSDPLADSAADDQGDQGDYVHIRIQQVSETRCHCSREP